MERNLKESGKKVYYCGFLLQEFQTNMTAIRTLIYNDWDKDSRKSPPQERPGREGPGESVPPPNLQILAWAQNRPLFPAALLTRFAEGTPEFDKINGLKKSFEVRFPAPAPATQNAGPARVGGMCDFSIDDGRPPLDLSRSIDLPCIPAADFTKPRLDWSQSKFDPTLFPYSKSQTVLQPNFSESVSWFWKIVDVDMSIDPCFVINNETDFVSIQQVSNYCVSANFLRGSWF